MSKTELPEVSKEFWQENQKIKHAPKKGGPYSKQNKDARRNEVYRLHFDYGYSARKISELMKVNRNTINGDISYWYSKITEDYNLFNPEPEILITVHRLENQRTRLREELDKAVSIQEKLAIERFIYDINSKILNTHQRFAESSKRIWDLSINGINEWMKENKKTERYLTLSDKLSVSSKAKEKISKIIKEDRKQRKFL